jgi:hypothetical protein
MDTPLQQMDDSLKNLEDNLQSEWYNALLE